MTKFTPGPWDYWSGYNPYDKIEAQVTAEGGDIVIASYNHRISEGEANAKLMAAAPELLQSLTNLVGLARLGAANLSKYHAALADAEAIIAKATA